MDQFFIAVNQWMSGQGALAFLGCFLWGMISVALSPCHMASIPLVVSYVAGQNRLLEPREAARYAVVFTVGLFITIAAIGVVCALLGRMLGDVSPYWTIAVGLLLLWVACDMMGVPICRMPGANLGRFQLRGLWGALVLGLSYGILSGSCTFGFIAPILAVITVQGKIVTGVGYILSFGMGHCLPIAVAGSFTALIRRIMENGAFQQRTEWFRRAAGGAIAVLGVYFILRPFFFS
ncbi:cytochrome c-type biogenesis protein [Desulfacinum infernum DSM 9756]|uniref:Cytochrome c-type biogenesis protein n=1 Tax=Desulfacinum infernum DSM 9756 TaxID=1121391 RepID=A0A1M4TXN6_9BACT|nr:cytochrome c biogenesis protein CcdA [Desulfacinum infernum]SHE49188.1 cytochrome c-type biogenesis protein [Desulfacinum infernum DSM 9756]